MLLFRKQLLIATAGAVWLIVGLLLLAKGVFLLCTLSTNEGILARFFERKASVFPFLIGLGFLLGWAKGHFLLSKSVKRTIARLSSCTGLIHFSKLYRLQDYVLIMAMIALGRFLQWIHCPCDLRGMMNIAIGFALLFGAVLYFRFANKEKSKTVS